MSIDDQYRAALDDMFGRKPPVASLDGVHPVPCTITAAAISKPRLLITTVEFSASSATVADDRSGHFDLRGRDTDAVRALSSELAEFLRSRRIGHLHLRVSTDAGRFSAHGHAMKIETILQLIPGLFLTMHSTQSVSAWIRREDPQLPSAAPLGLGSRWEDVRDSAFETAFFVAYQGAAVGAWG